MATLSVFLPTLFPCTPFPSKFSVENKTKCSLNNVMFKEDDVVLFNCPQNMSLSSGTSVKSYNEVATLLFLTGEHAIHHLFSRETHLEFNFGALLITLPCYFILACWAANPSISSGVVIPKMFIGGLMGRIIGRLMIEAFGCSSDPFWAWMDPGAFALIGAAAFFGGVSRLTMSLTVIMVELTNDVQFLLLIMVAIMVSKWVGDYITHPFYHAQLELKCIPFLDSEPVVLFDKKRNVNLELFEACHVMSSPVITMEIVISVYDVAKILLKTNHCGFPVIKKIDGLSTFYGLITRTDLCVLLCHEELFHLSEDEETFPINYSQFCEDDVEKLPKSSQFLKLLATLGTEEYSDKYLNLASYVNRSAVCVQKQFSLHRTYIIFRSLGLRHMVVVDDKNQVAGIITRKDLMGFNIEIKLLNVMKQRFEVNEDS